MIQLYVAVASREGTCKVVKVFCCVVEREPLLLEDTGCQDS